MFEYCIQILPPVNVPLKFSAFMLHVSITRMNAQTN